MTTLTLKSLKDAKPKSKVYYIWDEQIKGLALKVNCNGTKKFVLKYRTGFGGTKAPQRWYSFGNIYTHSLKEARVEAICLLRDIYKGIDPQSIKTQKRQTPTLKEFWEIFKIKHILQKNKKEQYMKSANSMWHQHIKNKIGNKKITDIKKEDIEKIQQDSAHTKYHSNRCISLINLMFNLMYKWEYLDTNYNPCKLIDKYKEEARERYLSNDELNRFIKELKKAEKRANNMVYTVSAIKLLLLTGARKSEILTAKWEWVDFEQQTISLPDSKTGKKTLYLTPQAIDILKILNKRPERYVSEYIIKNKNFDNYLKDIKASWKTIMRNSEIENFRVHDLRHTAASIAISNGHNLTSIAKLLGHKSIATTNRYAHLSQKAVFEVANTISNIVNF